MINEKYARIKTFVLGGMNIDTLINDATVVSLKNTIGDHHMEMLFSSPMRVTKHSLTRIDHCYTNTAGNKLKLLANHIQPLWNFPLYRCNV